MTSGMLPESLALVELVDQLTCSGLLSAARTPNRSESRSENQPNTQFVHRPDQLANYHHPDYQHREPLPAAILRRRDRDDIALVIYNPLYRDENGFRTFSWRDLASSMLRWAAKISSVSPRKGDCIGIAVSDVEHYVLLCLGCMASGRIPVPLYPPTSGRNCHTYFETLLTISKAANLECIVCDDSTQTLLSTEIAKNDHSPIGVTLPKLASCNDLCATDIFPEDEVSNVSENDIALVQFTSGTTANPKGIVVRHHHLMANLGAIGQHGLQLNQQDRVISWLPLYHDMGLIGQVFTSFMFGMPLLLTAPSQFIKKPRLWMEFMYAFHASITFAPNFAFALCTRRITLQMLEGLSLNHVKAIGCGAEPIDMDTLEEFSTLYRSTGLSAKSILPVYGMAEATLAISFSRLSGGAGYESLDRNTLESDNVARLADSQSERTQKIVSCGSLFPQHHCHIRDERGNSCPERHIGEIYLSGPSITDQYLDQKGAMVTRPANTELATGDLGYLFQGRLFVTGRKKDLLIFNGRNYEPQAIEALVMKQIKLKSGFVVAIGEKHESNKATESLVLLVESRTKGDTKIQRAVQTAVNHHFAILAKEIVFLRPGTLPRTTSGKLIRWKAKSLYREQAFDSSNSITQ